LISIGKGIQIDYIIYDCIGEKIQNSPSDLETSSYQFETDYAGRLNIIIF